MKFVSLASILFFVLIIPFDGAYTTISIVVNVVDAQFVITKESKMFKVVIFIRREPNLTIFVVLFSNLFIGYFQNHAFIDLVGYLFCKIEGLDEVCILGKQQYFCAHYSI